MHIMSKQSILAAAKRAFHAATVTLSADSHPVEFGHWVAVRQNFGEWWGITENDFQQDNHNN